MKLLRHRREHADLHHAVERHGDQSVVHLRVEALEDRAEHQHLLFVALGNLSRRRAGSRGHARNHQEDVLVERFINAPSHVLNVHQKRVETQVDFVGRPHPLHLRYVVRPNDPARNQVRFLIAHVGRHDDRGIGLLSNGLGLVKLLLLKLAKVAERFHARPRPVDVAARHIPTGRENRKLSEARLAKDRVALAVLLEIDRPERHVLRVSLLRISKASRLNGVDDLDPLVIVPAIVEPTHVRRHLVVAELPDERGDRHAKFSIARVHVASSIGRQSELADGERHAMDDGVVVVEYDHRRRAESSELLVRHLQGAVDIRLVEDHLHEGRHLRHPLLDFVVLVQLRVLRRETEPRASRARHARHHAARQGAKRSRA